MRQLVMRGCNINHMSSVRKETPLLYAIKKEYPVNLIRFLLSCGANPHIEGPDGKDACDIAQGIPKYQVINKLARLDCKRKPRKRISYKEIMLTQKGSY